LELTTTISSAHDPRHKEIVQAGSRRCTSGQIYKKTYSAYSTKEETFLTDKDRVRMERLIPATAKSLNCRRRIISSS